jgi:antitoxin component YwqK of YwqJK toxin-antitoxin module
MMSLLSRSRIPRYYIRRDYHNNGKISCLTFYKDSRIHHDDDRPAIIWYREDGTLISETYYKNNLVHRDNDRPAEIEYKECGEVNSETYWENGVEYKP